MVLSGVVTVNQESLPTARPMDRTPHHAALQAENFDRYQRLATIARVCERLLEKGCTTVADVGGFPGLLADHLPVGLTCRAVIDLAPCPRADHVCGSALALPLRDEAVDVALCADTLEHVGDSEQAARELARVARHAAVISAPWKSEATEAIERRLDEWHRRITGQPHPWLSEHRERGLPDRDAVAGVFRTRGWHTVELACGNLWEWTLLQIAPLALDLLPAGHVDFEAFNRIFNAQWPLRLTTRLPAQPYRTLLVAVRDVAMVEGLEDAEEASDAGPIPLTATMDLVEGLLLGLQEALTSSVGQADQFDRAYRERLETLTAQQAAEIEALRAEIKRLRGRPRGGIANLARRAVTRLSGRG